MQHTYARALHFTYDNTMAEIESKLKVKEHRSDVTIANDK